MEHGGLAGNTGGRWRSELERVLLPYSPLERYEEGAATACV